MPGSCFGRPLPGRSRRTLREKVDGLEVTYYFDLPRGYTPRKPHPLCIALHGGGAGAGDGAEAMSSFGRIMGSMGAIAAAPTAPELIDGAWNCPRGFRVVRALIEEIGAHYNVDWNRIYVGGHSMGGYGSYFEAIWWPDRFAACLSSAGGISAGSVGDFEVLYNTPLFVIHGTEDDRQAPIDYVRAADKAINMLPLKPRFYAFREIPGAGHGFDAKYRKQAALKMWKHTRDPYPEKVVCICPNYWDTQAHRRMGTETTGRAFWVEILGRTGRDFNHPAKVVAEYDKRNNEITVTTPPVQRVKHKGPADLDVQLTELANTTSRIGICIAEDVFDLSQRVKITCNGRVVFHDFVDRSVDYLLDHLDRTGDFGMPFSARVEFGP